MKADKPKAKMIGGVRRRSQRGKWSYVIDLGFVPALRCEVCNARFWVGHRRLDACPKCGVMLRNTSERRQQWVGGYETAKAARAARAKALTDLSGGLHVARDDVTVKEYLTDVWLPSLKGTALRPSTLAAYEGHVNLHITPSSLGERRLQDLTREAVQSFYGELRESGRVHGKKPLSAATVRRVHATLHRACRDAVRSRLLPVNPTTDIELPAGDGRERVAWTSQQLASFLKTVRLDRLAPLWLLYGTTGGRRGEILGLRWSDVTIAHDEKGAVTGGTIAIRKTLLQVKGEVIEGTPKTERGRRVIALDPASAAALERQRRLQDQEHKLLGDEWVGTGFVFTTERGEPLVPDAVTRAFRRAVDGTELPSINLHGLRHTFATVSLNELRAPVTQVSARLGHRDPSVTLGIYSHAIAKQDEALAADVASIVVPEDF